MFSSVFTYVQDIADPFFAYCKMHAEKMMSRAKRRNWLAIQSHIRKHPEKKIEDEKEKVGSSRNLKYDSVPSFVSIFESEEYITNIF